MPAPEQPYRPYLERFKDPQGPGDQRPTATEIVKDQHAEGKLEGKVVLITGGTGGCSWEVQSTRCPKLGQNPAAKPLLLSRHRHTLKSRDDRHGVICVVCSSE